jgi:histidine ammonia-lyase
MHKAIIPLTGNPLTFPQLRLIGARRAKVAASTESMQRVRLAREALETAIAGGKAIYGVNTGVGAMKDVSWNADNLATFNLGLVRAHHFGTGTYFPQATIRKAIAIRINTLLRGHTGCSPALVEAFLNLLRVDAIPAVRRTGSIGCADIGLMGQIGTVLTGGGEVFFRGRRRAAHIALEAAGLAPLQLAPRDALASLAVNCIAFAAAAAALRRAARAVRLLSVVSLCSSAALGASRDPWRSAIGVGGPDQSAIAEWFWRNSQRISWKDGSRLQDPLSLRMLPQIFGAAFGQLRRAGDVVLEATSQTDDNPVILADEVLTSGGSLPLDVSIAMQSCQLVVAHVARNVFNRSSILMNGGRRDLPVNLVPAGVVSTGFGPALKLVGDLYVRILALSSPLSPQQLSVANGIEDEASYLPLIIERLEEQVDALLHMAALEALFAAQAIDISREDYGGPAAAVYQLVRRHSAPYSLDRPLSAEIEALKDSFSNDADHLLDEAAFGDFDGFFDLLHATAPA